ncbi:uncharacterized protein PSFLO_02379 [Pseudozyma flocculosa]|uniref:Uncharacterized protein n=1 Tax=Pseudozyma flocculosa TaxID=84751 RepID=A0A5C3EXF8_9BASI|nr:uncharacterized protein PSFLO_02379 [Pseudozyma flocculosa]
MGQIQACFLPASLSVVDLGSLRPCLSLQEGPAARPHSVERGTYSRSDYRDTLDLAMPVPSDWLTSVALASSSWLALTSALLGASGVRLRRKTSSAVPCVFGRTSDLATGGATPHRPNRIGTAAEQGFRSRPSVALMPAFLPACLICPRSTASACPAEDASTAPPLLHTSVKGRLNRRSSSTGSARCLALMRGHARRWSNASEQRLCTARQLHKILLKCSALALCVAPLACYSTVPKVEQMPPHEPVGISYRLSEIGSDGNGRDGQVDGPSHRLPHLQARLCRSGRPLIFSPRRGRTPTGPFLAPRQSVPVQVRSFFYALLAVCSL